MILKHNVTTGKHQSIYFLQCRSTKRIYLTIIPWARVGYEMIDSQRGARSAELAINISYPTSASGIIVLLKTPPKYRKLDYNKNKKAQKITLTLAIFVDHGIMSHIPWWLSQWKLSNCIIQFPINIYIYISTKKTLMAQPPSASLSNTSRQFFEVNFKV